MAEAMVKRWWRGLDRPGWRSFFIAMLALSGALGLALYSAAAAESGYVWLAGGAAIGALGVAAWVGLTIVPRLARRTPLRFLSFKMTYRLTREGVIYLAGIFLIILAALNTGNNLLFLILASMLAGILVSGVLSRMVLTGVGLKMELPEHIFAEQAVPAMVELRNVKEWLPSFSVRVVDGSNKERGNILSRPVYFPYIPRKSAAKQKVELQFARRGVYRQEAFGLRTRFPFGFLEKTRKVESPLEIVAYPPVGPTEKLYEVLPLVSGEMESYVRGRGHDLYSLREYLSTDSARFVDWKASAKTGTMMVREFAREDERRVLLVLDPFLREGKQREGGKKLEEQFELGVRLCAGLAWHFHELNSVIAFRTEGVSVPMGPASECIYDILRALAVVEAKPAVGENALLDDLADETHVFKIIVTSRTQGTIPTSLWTSSYFVFLESL